MKADFLKAGGKVYLNSEVTKIKQREDSVNVECKDGQEFASDYVVVATTANVATDIVKGLPTEKYRFYPKPSTVRLPRSVFISKTFPLEKN